MAYRCVCLWYHLHVCTRNCFPRCSRQADHPFEMNPYYPQGAYYLDPTQLQAAQYMAAAAAAAAPNAYAQPQAAYQPQLQQFSAVAQPQQVVSQPASAYVQGHEQYSAASAVASPQTHFQQNLTHAPPNFAHPPPQSQQQYSAPTTPQQHQQQHRQLHQSHSQHQQQNHYAAPPTSAPQVPTPNQSGSAPHRGFAPRGSAPRGSAPRGATPRPGGSGFGRDAANGVRHPPPSDRPSFNGSDRNHHQSTPKPNAPPSFGIEEY